MARIVATWPWVMISYVMDSSVAHGLVASWPVNRAYPKRKQRLTHCRTLPLWCYHKANCKLCPLTSTGNSKHWTRGTQGPWTQTLRAVLHCYSYCRNATIGSLYLCLKLKLLAIIILSCMMSLRTAIQNGVSDNTISHYPLTSE